MADLMRVRTPASMVFAGAFWLACRSGPAVTVGDAGLGGDVARVGPIAISKELVAAAAQAKGEPARQALEGLVADALYAHGAQIAGLERDPAVRVASSALLAQRVMTKLLDSAREMGPPSSDELASRTVIQAVVLRPTSFAQDHSAALGAAIRQAVIRAATPVEFAVRAKAVPAGTLRVAVESVGPFSAAGQAEDGDTLDPFFVAAAFALHQPGEISPVIKTRFGWHVLRLVEIMAPRPDAIEARRAQVAPEVLDLRARQSLQTLLLDRAARAAVELSSSAEALLQETSRDAQ
jgi:peptidyl-prolyl cis-trans isomerase C